MNKDILTTKLCVGTPRRADPTETAPAFLRDAPDGDTREWSPPAAIPPCRSGFAAGTRAAPPSDARPQNRALADLLPATERRRPLTGQCAHALFDQRGVGQVDQHDDAEHEAVPDLHLPPTAAPNAPEGGAQQDDDERQSGKSDLNLVERLGRPHVAQLTGRAQQGLARRTDGRLRLKEGLDGWGPPHGVEGSNADDLKVVEQDLLDGLAHLHHSPSFRMERYTMKAAPNKTARMPRASRARLAPSSGHTVQSASPLRLKPVRQLLQRRQLSCCCSAPSHSV